MRMVLAIGIWTDWGSMEMRDNMKMGLSRKTFLYSIVLAVIMIAFVIGYFILMLPSLYVDYVMKSNLDSVVKVQQNYMENRTYQDLTVRNPSSIFSLEIPGEGREVYLEGKFFKLTVKVRDEELQEILEYVREMAGGEKFDPVLYESNLSKLESIWNDGLKDKFMGQSPIAEDYPVEIEMEQRNVPGVYQGEYSKIHSVSDDIMVFESGVSSGNYSYTTYVAMGWTKDSFIMTVMPTMTPQMEEITPIVRESLPMIIAVIFLVVLVSSRFFAGKIVNPVIRLADYAESAGMSGSFEADEFEIKSGDEIEVLGRNLHELYEKLRENYEELERKNSLLEEENERKEVFLRASSHQLKTPVAAALLLVDGMIHEVGKYKDTKAYLPEVKKQLLSMRGIVEDILYLNHCVGNMQAEKVDLGVLARELAKSYAVQAEDRELRMDIKGEGSAITDRDMLRVIVDNLLSNAVQYTPRQQRIVIAVSDNELCVTNYGVTIDRELLPNIFEPFVTSDTGRKGKGLGLYVASYYCRHMGGRLEIVNVENGVQAKISFYS